jgi:hypothetical protein
MQSRWQILIPITLGSLIILVAGLMAGCNTGAPTGDSGNGLKPG